MNKTHRFIFKSNTHGLFKARYQQMCQKKPPCDMIGPADPVSNLHHIKYAIREDETPAEKELRKHREDLQKWNEQFWTKHNLNFLRGKKEFLSSELDGNNKNKQSLTADEISVFYKDFLDKNWKTHMNYLLEWYKRNVFVTYLHFKVNVEKLFKKAERGVIFPHRRELQMEMQALHGRLQSEFENCRNEVTVRNFQNYPVDPLHADKLVNALQEEKIKHKDKKESTRATETDIKQQNFHVFREDLADRY